MVTISDAIMPMNKELYMLAKNEEAPMYQPPEDTYMLACCRHGYLKVAQALADTTRRVLLPGYTCETCIKPFVHSGWTPSFYGVGKDLRLDEKQFLAVLEATKPDVVVAQRLYGMEFTQRERELFAYAKEQGAFLLEDITHSIFTKPDDLFDVSTGSAMKWFPIPDGAIYRSKVLPIENMDELEEHTDYAKAKLDLQYVRHKAYETDDQTLYTISSHMLGDITKYNTNVMEIKRMSDASFRILSQEDFEANSQRRLENAKILWDGLKGHPRFERIYKDISDAVTGPLWFPTYMDMADRVKRKEIRKEILAAGVQGVGLWPLKTAAAAITDDVKYIYKNIVVFPISQNYGKKDMEYILEVLWDKAK